MTLLTWLTAITAAVVVLVLVGYLVGTAIKLVLALSEVKKLADALEQAEHGTASIAPLIDAATSAMRRIEGDAGRLGRIAVPGQG